MLRNERGRFLQSYELMPKLGFKPGDHLPKEGFNPVEVEGVTFWCAPAQIDEYTPQGRKVKVSKHRIRYLCRCRQWIPFGRAGQHDPACLRDHGSKK